MDFEQAVTLVTGGASGIGLACAGALLARGCRVAVNDRDAPGLEAAAASLIDGETVPKSRVLAVPGDVTDSAAVASMFDRVERAWGPVTTLVNNAGVSGGRMKLAEIGEDQWDAMMVANLRGMYLCTRRALPAMYESRWGRIVNMASIAGVSAKLLASAHYSAAKGAIVAFTKRVSMEAAPHNVAVNCVAPGLIADTGFTRAVKGDLLKSYLASIPLGRPGTCREVAELVAFLCSEHAGYIIGQTVVMDGGAST